MHFRKILALRGPNIWANYPVLEAWLDLESLEQSPSDVLPGFNERLMAWMPTLIEHRCSIGERGGFFERLRRGTWMGHILEHVALELQTLAGTEVGFGRTRETHEDGVYKVAVEYENEELGRAALETGLSICLAGVHDSPMSVDEEIEKLRNLAKRSLPNPTTTALLRAARDRRIPAQMLTSNGLLNFGHGKHQRRLLFTQTDRTGTAAESIAHNHELMLSMLGMQGLPVPRHETVSSAVEAWEAAEEFGLPVVLVSLDGGSRAHLQSREQVSEAYAQLAGSCERVLVEKQVSGSLWRLLTVGERLVSATLVHPASAASISAGTEVSGAVHQDFEALAGDAARIIGLDVAGIDVVAADIRRPLQAQEGAIVGIDSQPSLQPHLQPRGGRQPAAEAILARLYPEGQNGRIPVVAVTGVNGKTTTTRMIAHLASRAFRCVGFTCTEGIHIDGRRIESGDCSGPVSARTVLHHPRVDAAVLETARGGILRAGLGFDRCDVGVVTNIGEGDHLGLGDIQTPEELARVKCVVVEAVAKTGTAVLKADDPLAAAMAEKCRGSVLFFCRDGNHPVMESHRARQGRTAFVRDHHIILAEGDEEISLLSLDRIPLTHGGRIGFQVDNVLAAAAAAWVLGIKREHIRSGLESFSADLSKSPGRFNLFEINGATVILDYGHNASALASLIEAMEHLPQKRRVAVYSTAGDRRDCDLIRQGELLGNAFDRVILYEDHYLRGRKEGEIIALFRQGVEHGVRAREIEEMQGAVKAMEYALTSTGPGEVVLLQADVVDESVEFIRQYLASRLEAQEITLEDLPAAETPAEVPVEGGAAVLS